VPDAFVVSRVDGEFKASTKLQIQGPDDDQSLTIHTSCSKQLNVGDVFGSLTLIQLTTTAGGTATLPDPNQEATTCVAAGDGPGTSCDSRPFEIIFEYTGDSCAATTNTQAGTLTCAGDPAFADPVSVVYTGNDPADITVSPMSGIGVNSLFALTATGRDELHSNSPLEITDAGGVLQSLSIHTSCSKPLALGDQFGSLRVIEFSSEDDGTVTLPDPGPPPEPTNECAIQSPPPPPHCTTKVEALSLRYLGGDCSETTNLQEGKLVCTDINPTVDPARIVVRKDGNIFLDTGSPADVSFGDIVDALASVGGKNELPAESTIEIFDTNGFLLQEIKLHTSCSKPLNLGDRFGAVEVFAIDRKDDGLISLGGVVEYQYVISNANPNSGVVDNVTVVDSELGVIASGLSIPENETVTIFELATLFEDTTNIVTVTGDSAGQMCLAGIADATVTVEPPPEVVASCETTGKPQVLVFEYTGDPCSETTNLQDGKSSCSGALAGEFPVQIVITKDLADVTVSPSLEVVSIGDLVTFTATGSTLKSSTEFDIVQDGNVLQSLKIHTSCSKPLAVGDQFGSMILTFWDEEPVEISECLCWTEAEMDLIAPVNTKCAVSTPGTITITKLTGRASVGGPREFAQVVDGMSGLTCGYQADDSRSQGLTTEEYLVCLDSITVECDDRGIPLP
jgi:hypothetical protein